MLKDVLSMILYPIQQLLLLIDDSKITSYFGVSIFTCLVTVMITIIVVRALTSPIGLGSMMLKTGRNVKISKRSEKQTGKVDK